MATYGEDVRRSIHDAIQQSYTDIADSVERANAAAEKVEDIELDYTDLKSALGTVPPGKTAQGQITDNARDIANLKSALKSGKEEDAIWHLGFYLDDDGDLCQN